MNTLFAAAAILSFAVFLVHTFAGGRAIATPLLKARDLHQVPKLTTYYCWHLVTIVLAVISGMFLLATLRPDSLDVAWIATLLTGTFCLFGLVLPIWHRQSYKHMPQGWLFLPIVVLGVAGGFS